PRPGRHAVKASPFSGCTHLHWEDSMDCNEKPSGLAKWRMPSRNYGYWTLGLALALGQPAVSLAQAPEPASDQPSSATRHRHRAGRRRRLAERHGTEQSGASGKAGAQRGFAAADPVAGGFHYFSLRRGADQSPDP